MGKVSQAPRWAHPDSISECDPLSLQSKMIPAPTQKFQQSQLSAYPPGRGTTRTQAGWAGVNLPPYQKGLPVEAGQALYMGKVDGQTLKKPECKPDGPRDP